MRVTVRLPKGGEYMSIKQKIVSIIAFLVMVLTPVAVMPAYAASSTSSSPNFFQGLVQFIAQKFGLDQTQVQSAVNTYHSQQAQNRQQKMADNEKTHLDTLVSQGKITSSQEQQILDEQAKLKSEYNPANFKNETPAQRKADFQKEQAEIQAWSQSTGIDGKYLMPGFGMGRRMGMFNRWNNKVTPTPTP